MFYSGRISPMGITEFVLKPVLRPWTPTSDRGRQPERASSEPSSFQIFTKRGQQCVNSENKTCNSEKTTKQLVIFVFVLSGTYTIFFHIICCKRRLSRVLISKSFHPVHPAVRIMSQCCHRLPQLSGSSQAGFCAVTLLSATTCSLSQHSLLRK